MIKKNLFLLLLISINLPILAAKNVPDSISIGNLKVFIHPSAKPILEKEWNMISSNRKYVAGLICKMRLYFPVIEPILKQGNVPDEFKYLCVQESSLNPNAISTSQAVGYWQFKQETAKEVGMKINQNVDERRHILEATKGAVNYFNRNNNVLNNWMSTLLSYRIGLGSLKKSSYYTNWLGKTEIVVDSSTDWYILRFIAYKNFWEDQVGCFSDTNAEKNDVSLICYNNAQGKNLYELSDELKISFDDLKKHNPWILKDFLPNDKTYTIYHPSNVFEFSSATLPTYSNVENIKDESNSMNELTLTASIDSTKLFLPTQKSKALYPKKKYKEILSDQVEIKIHKITQGDNLTELALKYNMSLDAILKLNNLEMNSLLSIGQTIKYARKIPMLELISQKLDEKAQKMAEKLPKKEIEYDEKESISDIKEDYSTRVVNTKIEKEPLLIEPATSREINVKTDKDPKSIWVDSQLPEKKLDRNVKKEVTSTEISEKKNPISLSKKEKPNFHLVKAGENLFKISKLYQISIEDLVKWNALKANQSISIGQKIQLTAPK
jgi:membrane-bound lytic murein transglycosylase D